MARRDIGSVWVTDLRHFLDARGRLPDLPGPAMNLVLFFGSIAGWVTSHPSIGLSRTNVPCRRSPGRKRCVGEIHAGFQPGSMAIAWHCPVCGDNGHIDGWVGTRWDRRGGAAEPRAVDDRNPPP